jgi:hypothetical protein
MRRGGHVERIENTLVYKTEILKRRGHLDEVNLYARDDIVTYWWFYSRWVFISTQKNSTQYS